MKLWMDTNDPIEKEVIVDYKTKTIKCAESTEQDLELEVTQALKQAELIYSILREDVVLVRSKGVTYI